MDQVGIKATTEETMVIYINVHTGDLKRESTELFNLNEAWEKFEL